MAVGREERAVTPEACLTIQCTTRAEKEQAGENAYDASSQSYELYMPTFEPTLSMSIFRGARSCRLGLDSITVLNVFLFV